MLISDAYAFPLAAEFVGDDFRVRAGPPERK